MSAAVRPPYLHRSDSFIGRSAEESILLNSYFASLSMTRQDNGPAVILIHGDSGLGKTKLAETLRPHVIGDDGYFIRGKFDQLSYGSANRPYSAIASAFAEYCSALEEKDQETINEVTNKLRQEIKGEEGKLLFQAIPSLRRIIGDECHHHYEEIIMHRRHSCDACLHMTAEEGNTPESLDSISDTGSHRLNYLIKRVISVISSIGDPIVCLIDDIQWANKTEIDVLRALMIGAISPFVFIFTCRPGNHPFLKITDEFGGKTDIVLQSLKRNSVRELVAEILNIDDPDDCTSLANYISRVTNGNPFFIRQQIILLSDEGLIRSGNSGWVWDMEELEEIHDDVFDNVVIMLSEKIKRLPSLTQQSMAICSCIGSKIDLFVLGLLLRETQFIEGTDTQDNEALAKMAISVACQEGLLAITQNGKGVTFTHDSVNEAAYYLLDPIQQATYHFKLGQILHKNLCPNLFQKYLFTIAAQLARGNELITDEVDRIATVSIFMSAGQKSMAASAFPEAHFFFSKGIHLLCEDDWTNNYQLCCDIYMKDADTAAITGDFQDMEICLAILFDHCKESLVDFLNASYIQVRAMTFRDDPAALDVGLAALRAAGEDFPSHNLVMHAILGLARTKWLMKRKGGNKLLQLPDVTDKLVITKLRLFSVVVNNALSFNQKLLPLLCFRVVQLNLTHGMSKAMPCALALYGLIISRLGNITEAAKYGEIALTLQENRKSNENLAQVTILTYGSAFTRTKKMSECLKPLRAAFDSGVKTGNIEHSMGCAQLIGWMSFHSGRNLAKVAMTLDKLRTSMSEYNMTRAIKGNRNYRNAVDYFLGVSDASRFFLPIDSDDSISCRRTNLVLCEQEKFLQLVGACIFCEYDIAWKMSQMLCQFGSVFGGTIWPYICTFYRGMTATSLLNASKSRQFIRTAKSCLKELRTGRKKSGINLLHLSYLLEAEYAAFRKKYTSAEKYYSLAIKHASLAGVTHEYAFACERFGTYHLLRKNHDAAYKQIREAHRLYSKWGSRPKCELLKKKYPRLDEKVPVAPVSIARKKR